MVLPLLPLVEEDTVEGGMPSVVVVVAVLVDTEAIDHELDERKKRDLRRTCGRRKVSSTCCNHGDSQHWKGDSGSSCRRQGLSSYHPHMSSDWPAGENKYRMEFQMSGALVVLKGNRGNLNILQPATVRMQR